MNCQVRADRPNCVRLFFVKLAVIAEPTASVGISARETAARACARGATAATAVVHQTSASAPKRPNVASAPSVVSSVLCLSD